MSGWHLEKVEVRRLKQDREVQTTTSNVKPPFCFCVVLRDVIVLCVGLGDVCVSV